MNAKDETLIAFGHVGNKIIFMAESNNMYSVDIKYLEPFEFDFGINDEMKVKIPKIFIKEAQDE